jgi:hypothetical protein
MRRIVLPELSTDTVYLKIAKVILEGAAIGLLVLNWSLLKDGLPQKISLEMGKSTNLA